MQTIEIYGAKIATVTGPLKDCVWCARAKALVAHRGYRLAYHDVTEDSVRARELAERAPGTTTVPQIFVGSHHVGGFTDLAAADRSGALQQLIAGA